jgi:alkylhydroperoxidase family enzyme
MARLPYVDPEQASPQVASALAELPPLSIFRMLAQAETAFRPWLRLGGTLLTELELDPILRELAILRIARLCGSEYEWNQHRAVALEVGAGEERVEAIDRGDYVALADDERAVLDFTTEAVRDGRAGAESLERLRQFLPPRQVVELLLVIGHYTSVARIAETLDLDLDEPLRVEEVKTR